uniref:Putative apolipophorin-iii n=1 Tax=Culex tarsalis TaxID=7177 RepID=A0A1Q3G125_CULTA
MSKMFQTFIFLHVAQFLVAAPTEVPKVQPMVPSFAGLLQIGLKIHETAEQAHMSVRKVLGRGTSNRDVIRSIKNNTDELVEKLRGIQGMIKEQTAMEGEPLLRSLTEKLVQTADALSSEDPETAAKAREYLESLQASIFSLLSAAMKVGEKVDQEKDSAAEEVKDGLTKLYLVTNDTLRKTSEALGPKE